ncbi:retrovirus-related pol polyprotein from transposon TNT 1-94 [Tanacetum coccineum]|uniref:Retrovirus-related pol polyprotein from transposon TNT 1-94 n=1 Tax=Tanacetum coccineum TaxID=301880 RepID=A0ABQ4YG47_9ASTR
MLHQQILNSNFTFKADTLKGETINEPSSAPSKGNKNGSASKNNSAPFGKLKNVKTKDDYPLDIKKPIWYLDSGCSKHMNGINSYLYKYVKQPRPKVVFGDDSTCITEGYGSIKCNGIVFTKVSFVNGLKYNLVSISQLCDAKYIVQFDEKRGTIFNSNKEIVMISPRVRDVYILDMTSSAQESCFFAKATKNLNWLWHKRLAHLNFKTINQLAKQNLVIGLPSLVYSKDKSCSSCEKGKHHRVGFKTKHTSSIKKCLHLLHMDLFGPVTPRSINHEKYTLIIVDEYSRSTIVKRHLKTPYEIFRGRIPNIDFLHVFGCPVYIHNHKDYLGKFDEKADDGYFLGYSLVSKAFRVFNTRRQQTEETYHITFDESTDVIKFTTPLDDNIAMVEGERYTPDEYLKSYKPSQRYQVNSNVVSFINPYERLELVVIKTDVSSDQHDQTEQNDQNDQNDHLAQDDEILNDDHSKHSNHNNDNHIINNLPNIEDVQTSEPLSSPAEDTSVTNTIPILTNPSLSIPSMASLAPQDRWSQDKHNELVNIIGDPGAGMLTRAMAKELSAALAHECLFVDFLFEEEPKKVSEALKHPGWFDAMQGELNQFAINKVWTLVLVPYGKTIIGSKWVDDIIFGSTNTELFKQFAKLMTQRYKMSMIGVLTYFLGFQIKQSERGILINQEKYVKDLLKKYNINRSSVKTPMVPPNNLGPDLNGKDVNETRYRGFDLKGYSDSDYAGCNMDRKSTLGACHLLGGKLVCWSAKKHQYVAMSLAEVEYVDAAGCCANILWMKSQLTDYDIIYEKLWYIAKAFKNSKVWFSTPTGGILREVGVNTFRNSIGAHCLSHSSKYVAPPLIKTIRQWFPTIGYGEAVKAKGTLKKSLLPHRWSLANGVNIDYAKLIWEDIITKLNKKTREKVVPYIWFLSLLLEHKMKGYRNNNVTLNPTQVFSVHNWTLKKNQPEGPPFTEHMLAICNADMPVEHKAPNTSSYTRKKDFKGKKPGAKSRHRKQPTSSKHHHLSKIKATKGGSSKAPIGSKTGYLVKETQSSSALDTNPSQPPTFTPVVVGLHKEDQQAIGGPTSLRVNSERGSNPQLSSGMSASLHNKPIYLVFTIINSESASERDVSAKSKAGADSGLSAPKDLIPQSTGNDERPNKLSLDHIFAGREPAILQKKIEEEFNTSPDLSSSEDTQKEIKLEDLSMLVHDARVDFMDLDSYEDDHIIVIDESEVEEEAEEIHATKHTETEDTSLPNLHLQVKELKKHVHDLEIELSGDLKEIPNKLEVFTSTVESLTTQVAKLKTLQWELPAEFLSVPTQLQSIQAKIKTFPLKISSQPKGEHIKKYKGKNAMSSKDAEEKGSESDSDDTIYLTGSMVESSKKKKLKKFDFITEGGDHVHLTKEQIKEQKKIKESAKDKAAKHEVEVRKEELVDLLGPDMVVKACPNRKGKGWSIIYGQIQKRIDYLHKTKAELGIDLDKPLSEQDRLEKLNDLAKKKRKNADDIHDYFRANKRLKSSVQYKDHPARTVLNEPVLGMIMFNSYHRQDFVAIEDFGDFLNEMLYTIQEIFFRLHQGPRLDDHARTFSSLLLAKVDKKNLNPLNQMRTIEHMRQ